MIIKARAYRFGDDVNTDEIIPAKFLNTTDPKELGSHCMDGIRNLKKKPSADTIIVAGKNFGCGSSREHAPISIKGAGVPCVIAGSFARIFYRNCINTGLLIFESADASRDIKDGDSLEINVEDGLIKNLTKTRSYKSQKFSGFIEDLVNAGGLMAWVKKTYLEGKV